MSGALLSLEAVSAYYGRFKALNEVDLIVETGGVTAILGANGAGKTTLLRAISGLVRVEGSIEFTGRAIARLPPHKVSRCGVAHVPEGRGTFFELSVQENLELGGYNLPSRREIAENIERVFGYFPILKERRRQQAGQLSGGEQQMLAISRALMMRPTLLLIDEPSFGLAPLIVQDIFEIMAAINKRVSMGILLVEQNAKLALSLADRAYVLETGSIVFGGTAAEVRDNPVVRKSYLGR